MPPGLGRPLFSIGVTAYRRPRLLQEALESLTAQVWRDFEVLVGNDDPAVPMRAEQYGIRDERFRFMNHARNLGEIGNMNALLAASRGKYFTWLADDDCLLPVFFSQVQAALTAWQWPNCVVTNFLSGEAYSVSAVRLTGRRRLMSGKAFITAYLEQRLRAVGSGAIFERSLLWRWGGASRLGTTTPLYTDNLLAIKIGLLDRVAYLEDPLFFYRTHNRSQAWVSTDVAGYRSAQEALCRESVAVFRQQSLRPDFDRLLYHLLRIWCVSYYYKVVRRSSLKSLLTLPGYWRFIWRESRQLSAYRIALLAMVGRSTWRLAVDIIRLRLAEFSRAVT